MTSVRRKVHKQHVRAESGVVDEKVDPARSQRILDARQVRSVGEIGAQRLRVDAELLMKSGGEVAEAILPTSDQHEVQPLSGQRVRISHTDA